ncbi:glycoside hydrolase family 130 protein [Alicyclobacillus dauci]|uniref:Glycoside hydrolase family 130 protein n=1 Tax=Alicyclobacillus dauci TaxID=1475485 RepID=A0ABY6Z5K8_9BACL|nr:glycoside hydrolase family 130 protein [Alicyclobacillus dauci]WAH38164.1 glycoside hydrolase family 130 protein [Alicyclobacillus dauci]
MSVLTSQVKFPLGPFEKYQNNPIMGPQGDTWESKDLFNPTAIQKDGKIHLLYRAEDHTGPGEWNGTSRIGLAISEDGIHFERHPEPVLVPTESYELPGGCEDPRVTQVGDTYYLTYSGFNGSSAVLCLATSKDLYNWEKHGVLFPEWTEGSDKVWSKSGAILAEPINGKYVMYFGDTNIWIAYSEDLIHWTPDPKPVFTPSSDPMAFDSALIEPGPAPFVTDEGIVLIYNAARTITETNDASVGKLRYSAGQVLLSKSDPSKVISRTSEPFFVPGSRDEIVGQVDNVVFVEGLVMYKGTFHLYYGMADSKIGVATYRP